jgi:hypothetical protein
MPRQKANGGDLATSPAAPTALLASAVRYPGNAVKVYQGYQNWQQEAWRCPLL